MARKFVADGAGMAPGLSFYLRVPVPHQGQTVEDLKEFHHGEAISAETYAACSPQIRAHIDDLVARAVLTVVEE